MGQRLTGARNALDVDAVAHVAIHHFAGGGDRRVVHAFAGEHAFARLHHGADVLDVGDLVAVRAECDDRLTAAHHQHFVVELQRQIGRRLQGLAVALDALDRQQVLMLGLDRLDRFPGADIDLVRTPHQFRQRTNLSRSE